MADIPAPKNPDGEQDERPQLGQERARRLFSEEQDIFITPGTRSRRPATIFEDEGAPKRQDIFFERSWDMETKAQRKEPDDDRQGSGRDSFDGEREP
jgi:hypothetical protein